MGEEVPPEALLRVAASLHSQALRGLAVWRSGGGGRGWRGGVAAMAEAEEMMAQALGAAPLAARPCRAPLRRFSVDVRTPGHSPDPPPAHSLHWPQP